MSGATLDVLLEVGAEEIPHRFVPGAIEELRRRVDGLLRESALGCSALEAHGGPRRLTVIATGVAARQADRTEELVGPPTSAAYRDGQPTPAAVGFARKAGVEVSELRRKDDGKSERVVATRAVPGRSVHEVLAQALPVLVREMPWPKNMRWGDGTRTWVRPVHWVVALAGQEVIPVEIFGVRAGRTSRGHRTRSAGPVTITSPATYLEELRAAGVVAHRAERRELIEKGLQARARALGATLLQDPDLVDATCDLVEWPVVVAATFPERFLELPDVVLSTAMRVHQKFFALTGADGRLRPAFLHVANQDDPEGTIAANNAGVLVARLEDARFFHAHDLKTPLRDRVDSLARVLFHEKLGTYLQKVERMEVLAARIAALARAGASATADLVRAVRLCKADQTTDIVKEFTELQGVMGGIYLRLQGEPEGVCLAVEEHYLPQTFSDPVPRGAAGALLSVVDKVDTLVGCFGVGLVPTGSKDPFGLRRAAQGLVRTLLEAPVDVAVTTLVDEACALHGGTRDFDAGAAKKELLPFLEGRLRFVLAEGVPLAGPGAYFAPDEVAAVVGASWERLPGVLARARALREARRERPEDFAALSVAFKRVRNIVKGHPRGTVDTSRLLDPAERALWERVRRAGDEAEPLMARGAWLPALVVLAGLRPEVDAFFSKVFVMADDVAVRRNRIALLQAIEDLFLRVADISEIAAPAP